MCMFVYDSVWRTGEVRKKEREKNGRRQERTKERKKRLQSKFLSFITSNNTYLWNRIKEERR